jgi:hypothetical protein
MRRGRLERFDACPDCFDWKVRRFLSQRKENWERFKNEEIKNIDWVEIYGPQNEYYFGMR